MSKLAIVQDTLSMYPPPHLTCIAEAMSKLAIVQDTLSQKSVLTLKSV